MKDTESIIKKYLLLFGLDQNYTDEELQSSYRTLAKINHPDINKSPEAEIRMVLINEGYEYLKNNSARGTPVFFSREERNDYFMYKNAFEIVRKSFDDYFGTEKNSKHVNDLNTLKTQLLRAKALFADIINNHPQSDWTEDSIDKIFMINKWL